MSRYEMLIFSPDGDEVIVPLDLPSSKGSLYKTPAGFTRLEIETRAMESKLDPELVNAQRNLMQWMRSLGWEHISLTAEESPSGEEVNEWQLFNEDGMLIAREGGYVWNKHVADWPG